MLIEYLADNDKFIDELAELFYNEWSYLVPERSLHDFKRSIEERKNRDKIPMALILTEEDKLIGTACIKDCDMDTRKNYTPWLAGVYVKEQYRGRGYGKKLIEAIEKCAVEIGIETLYLYTPDKERFYIKNGWETIEKTEYNNTDVTIMKKKINCR